MRIVQDGQADMRGGLQVGSDSWLHPLLNVWPHVLELRIHSILPFSYIIVDSVCTGILSGTIPTMHCPSGLDELFPGCVFCPSSFKLLFLHHKDVLNVDGSWVFMPKHVRHGAAQSVDEPLNVTGLE